MTRFGRKGSGNEGRGMGMASFGIVDQHRRHWKLECLKNVGPDKDWPIHHNIYNSQNLRMPNQKRKDGLLFAFAGISGILVFICSTQSAAAASYGSAYTLYQKLSSSDFQCLIANGNGNQVPVIRIYAGGNVDPSGIENINNARTAGYTGIEVYVQPDSLGSKSASQHFNEAYNFINPKYPVKQLWLMVTDSRAWSSQTNTNIYFIQQFIKAANDKNVLVGIYTSWYDWLLITGNYKLLQFDCVGGCQLWYWHTLGQGPAAASVPDISDFRAFGSWQAAAVKEYVIVDNQLCGISLNWSVFKTSGRSANSNRSAAARKNGTTRRKFLAAEKMRKPTGAKKFVIGNAITPAIEL